MQGDRGVFVLGQRLGSEAAFGDDQDVAGMEFHGSVGGGSEAEQGQAQDDCYQHLLGHRDFPHPIWVAGLLGSPAWESAKAPRMIVPIASVRSLVSRRPVASHCTPMPVTIATTVWA